MTKPFLAFLALVSLLTFVFIVRYVCCVVETP